MVRLTVNKVAVLYSAFPPVGEIGASSFSYVLAEKKKEKKNLALVR